MTNLPFISSINLDIAAIAVGGKVYCFDHQSFLAVAAYETKDVCEQCNKIAGECDWKKCGNWEDVNV